MEESNLRKTRELYSYFGAGDIPALLAALDPDVVWMNPGPPEFAYFGVHRGRDAVAKNIFGFIAEHLDIQVFEPRNMLASGDQVVALIHVEAVARKTGRRIVQDVAHAFAYRDGRPVYFHDFQDNAQIAAALR